MKVKTVKGFACPECDTFIEKDEIPLPPELSTRYQCGECKEFYMDIDEAKECCRE